MDSAGTKRIRRLFHLHSINQEPDELQTIKNVSAQGDKVSITHEEDELRTLALEISTADMCYSQM